MSCYFLRAHVHRGRDLPWSHQRKKVRYLCALRCCVFSVLDSLFSSFFALQLFANPAFFKNQVGFAFSSEFVAALMKNMYIVEGIKFCFSK
jgi:predicted benzoate:H+ symporter BenE